MLYRVQMFWVAVIAGMVFLAVPAGSQQRPVTLSFQDTPCGSTTCDTLFFVAGSSADRITGLLMRDSVSFTVLSELSFPLSIPAGDTAGIPVCFSPSRRGNNTDSLTVTLETIEGTIDVKVRLTGKGIGPDLSADPIVLNFPKTNPGSMASLVITIRNDGELPYTLTAADLNIAAPFRLVTLLPLDIQPGDSVEVEIEFAPDANGIYSAAINLAAGCNRAVQAVMNGATDLIGTGAVIRISKRGFNPANNEQISCDVSQCTEVTLTNAGNAPLIIEDLAWALGTIGYTITSPPAVPFTIQPNTNRNITVCLNSQNTGVLRDTLLVTSNDRTSIAFGMVIDASGSMDQNIDCGEKIDEAIRQAQSFIAKTLLYIPSVGIQDELAIIKYNSNIEQLFPLTRIDNTTRTAAQASVVGIATGSSTNTGEALIEMINTLAASPLEDRVIVLLTDGEARDMNTFPAPNIVTAAAANNVRIFTIGLGLTRQSALNYVNALANGTGGQQFSASDCGSLQGAFEAITDVVSQGGVKREPFAIKVTSPVLVAENLRFDSTYIRQDTCTELTLTNVGEGDAIIDDVQFEDLLGQSTGEFYIDPSLSFPLIIQENDQRKVQICFRPEALRERGGRALFTYNDCFSVPVTPSFTGTGYAVANVRVDDTRFGLPGSRVTMPIYGDSALAGYDVTTITVQASWNNTLLELEGVVPGSRANGAAIAFTTPVHVEGDVASVDITVTGNALQQSGELVVLDFLILRGNAISTTVEIQSVVFEDGNPRPLVKNSGIIAYDSICFLDSKPILYQTPAKVRVNSISPMPVAFGEAHAELEAMSETVVNVGIYDTRGSCVVQHHDFQLIPGRNRIPLAVDGLEPGHYYVQFLTRTGATYFRKIILAR